MVNLKPNTKTITPGSRDDIFSKSSRKHKIHTSFLVYKKLNLEQHYPDSPDMYTKSKLTMNQLYRLKNVTPICQNLAQFTTSSIPKNSSIGSAIGFKLNSDKTITGEQTLTLSHQFAKNQLGKRFS